MQGREVKARVHAGWRWAATDAPWMQGVFGWASWAFHAWPSPVLCECSQTVRPNPRTDSRCGSVAMADVMLRTCCAACTNHGQVQEGDARDEQRAEKHSCAPPGSRAARVQHAAQRAALIPTCAPSTSCSFTPSNLPQSLPTCALALPSPPTARPQLELPTCAPSTTSRKARRGHATASSATNSSTIFI